ncbi:MAG TPA: hypothetical protein VI933_03315 [archaeon]|nr:hypothetical protein [archaeon]
MKGVLYTLVTYLILVGLLAYTVSTANTFYEHEKIVSEKISAEKVFHSWNSIAKNIAGLLNISAVKKDYTLTLTDTLPSDGGISSVLQNYESFLKTYYDDSIILYRFEDASGNIISLQNIDSKISIIPTNLNYSWPNFGKNSGKFESDAGGLKYVKRINMTIFVSPEIRDLSTISWSGYKACVQGTTDCLIFNLTVTDGTKTWVSDRDNFDLKFQAQLKMDLGAAGSPNWARVTIGKIPSLINLDMQNSNITQTSNIVFNTTDFFINYPSKLNVSNVFAKKVDWLNG